MNIKRVEITNWKSPGRDWWDGVRQQPDEKLIDATMKLTMSWNEYHAMIDADESKKNDEPD